MRSHLDVLNWSANGLFGAGEFRRKSPAGSWENGVSGKPKAILLLLGVNYKARGSSTEAGTKRRGQKLWGEVGI